MHFKTDSGIVRDSQPDTKLNEMVEGGKVDDKFLSIRKVKILDFDQHVDLFHFSYL